MYQCVDELYHDAYCSVCDANEGQFCHEFDGLVCKQCGFEKEPDIILGDASGDDTIDIFDALVILQFAVDWDVELNEEASDVNDDGKCDIFDALLILQYSVGWDVELK